MTVVYVIIALNVLISWKGFNDFAFFQRHKFHTDSILAKKEYSRLFSSGFLHADYTHLGFNMFTFYMFGEAMALTLSPFDLITIYLGSLLAGNLLALFIHRHHGDYSAIGASGAVSGIIYGTIILYPGLLIYFIIPGWLFGIIYILYSIFGIKKQSGNIGHDAHLGGAVAGLVLTVLLFFNDYDFNYFIVAGMLIPTAVFLYLIAYHPERLLSGKIDWRNNPISKTRGKKDTKPKTQYINREAELNQLLDKVNKVGYHNLSEQEKRRLDQLS